MGGHPCARGAPGHPSPGCRVLPRVQSLSQPQQQDFSAWQGTKGPSEARDTFEQKPGTLAESETPWHRPRSWVAARGSRSLPHNGVRKQGACSLTLKTVLSLSRGGGGGLTFAPTCHCTPIAQNKLENSGRTIRAATAATWTRRAWTHTGHSPGGPRNYISAFS